MSSFTYYNAGRESGVVGQPFPQDLYMFTCWNADHTSCGCFSVYADKVAVNVAALEKGGSINRQGQRYDYAARAWVRA